MLNIIKIHFISVFTPMNIIFFWLKWHIYSGLSQRLPVKPEVEEREFSV